MSLEMHHDTGPALPWFLSLWLLCARWVVSVKELHNVFVGALTLLFVSLPYPSTCGSQTTHKVPLAFKPMTRTNIRGLMLEEIAEFNLTPH